MAENLEANNGGQACTSGTVCQEQPVPMDLDFSWTQGTGATDHIKIRIVSWFSIVKPGPMITYGHCGRDMVTLWGGSCRLHQKAARH